MINLNKTCVIIIAIAIISPVTGYAEKYVLEGQGLNICEDAKANCIISIETDTGKRWIPSKVSGTDLIMEPSDCSCGLRLVNLSQEFDKNHIKFGFRDILVEYRIRIIPLYQLSLP